MRLHQHMVSRGFPIPMYPCFSDPGHPPREEKELGRHLPRKGGLRRRVAFSLAVIVFSCCALPALADESLETRGVIKALQRAVISGEIAARIKQLPKRTGESFRKGETLVSFECALFEAQRDKVAAEREGAETKLKNDRQLEALNSIGHLEVALSEAELKKAEAELRIARLNAERCIIRAPYDGLMVQVLVNEHESVREQQELLEIVDTGSLEAEIVVPANWLAWLKVGQPLRMRIDETGKTVDAKVIAIGATIDPVSQTTNVRARFTGKQSRLVPGMSGTANFSGEQGG